MVKFISGLGSGNESDNEDGLVIASPDDDRYQYDDMDSILDRAAWVFVSYEFFFIILLGVKLFVLHIPAAPMMRQMTIYLRQKTRIHTENMGKVS